MISRTWQIAAVIVLFTLASWACGSSKSAMVASTPAGEETRQETEAVSDDLVDVPETATASPPSTHTPIPPPPAPTATEIVVPPTATASHTPAPPTETLVPPTETPVPSPVVLQGTGQTATDPITPPAAISIAHFRHDGSRNFAIWVYIGDDRDLLVNTVGPYDGRRPVVSADPVVFDIQADGAWSIELTAIAHDGGPSFGGRGDDVSGLFDPPGTTRYEFTHDGTRNFAVWVRCRGGSDLLQNEIGQVSNTGMVRFPEGPCYWEITADGNWTLGPK